MNFSNISNLPTIPRLREASHLKSQREPDSVYRMWQFINDLGDSVNKSNQAVNQLNRNIQFLNDRNKLDFELFPFKIYVPSDDLRGGIPNTTNWRTVRVRGGYVLTGEVSQSSYVNGTDGYQQYAYGNSISIGTDPSDILLNTSSFNWFWIENNSSFSSSTSPYYLRYGPDPTSISPGNPTPWASFPQASSNYIPVGWVDTSTSGSIQQALIRQFLDTDVVSSGGSTAGYFDYNVSQSCIAGNYYEINPNNTASFGGLTLQSGSSTTPPLTPFVFLCVVNVPAGGLTGSASGSNNYPWNPGSGNYPWPFFPQWPESSIQTVSVISASVTQSSYIANQLYFKPISAWNYITVCINQVDVPFWGEMWPATYTYQYQLAYTGSM